MMITDFTQVKSLRVIERVQLQKLLEEMELGMSGMADENTAPRMGRLLRARNLVNGSFMVKAGKNLSINSDLIDVTETNVFRGDKFNGALAQILDIEKKIVFKTLRNLNLKLTKEVISRIKKNTTKNVAAFLAYCNGLDEYDLGNYESALSHFQQAIRLDPKFKSEL